VLFFSIFTILNPLLQRFSGMRLNMNEIRGFARLKARKTAGAKGSSLSQNRPRSVQSISFGIDS
jgi:hypothetical protein